MVESNDNQTVSELIDDYIGKRPDWQRVMLTKIRDIFHETDPEIVEEWKWMGSPAWSHDGLIAVCNGHKNKVKLTFLHGVHLQDTNNVFNAGLGGNKWRAIDLFKDDQIDEVGLKKLIQSAIDYNMDI